LRGKNVARAGGLSGKRGRKNLLTIGVNKKKSLSTGTMQK